LALGYSIAWTGISKRGENLCYFAARQARDLL
jgi:hypothetical protein